MAPPGETQASVTESAQPLTSATTSTGTGVTLTANGTDTPLATRNVGIVAMEMYFPSTYIEQTELEQVDNVGAGKYTVGLGQRRMSFVDDNEDIHSFALTVVRSLMTKYGIAYDDVGRLEVGTETLLDKSKSVKSVVMQLFGEHGNHDIEGIDTTNACYGGTAALLNTVAWVESSSWDGRYGLVVAGDIAVYGSPVARPTGGAGIVAMLVGPDAVLVLEPQCRASHMEHVYDFYKPDFASEYPTVDGKLSNACYLRAVDACYTRFCAKMEKRRKAAARHATGSLSDPEEERRFTLAEADFLVFHTPYVKLVQKSVARLMYLDFLRNPDDSMFASEPAVQAFRDVDPTTTYGNAELDKAFRKLSDPVYHAKVLPATLVAANTGNTYCASVYASLLSLLSNVASAHLLGKRIVLFSYGSGLAATMLSIRVAKPVDDIVRHADIMARLERRTAVPVADYLEIMTRREAHYNRPSVTPAAGPDRLAPGTYYLTGVSASYQRAYARTSEA